MRYLVLVLFLIGCGKNSVSHVSEAMDYLNIPESLPGADGALFITPPSQPDTGSVSQPVWGGSWYPYSQNGTARKPTPSEYSPLEKYDLANHDPIFKATNWELQKSNELRDISWAGHCNGLAAASTMAKEPIRGVWYNGVYFTVDDIKALLIEAWQDGGTSIGGRCASQEIAYDSIGRILDNTCRDTNPATFHILLTNFLGRFRKPLIIDTDSGYPVWNYPIVSYEVKFKTDLTTQDATRWLFGASKDTYEYNPMAKSFIYYQTQIVLSTGVKKIYEYILEINEYNRVIGGEWFRNGKTDHPDFIWRHTAPKVENPYLSVDTIYAIYNQSF